MNFVLLIITYAAYMFNAQLLRVGNASGKKNECFGDVVVAVGFVLFSPGPALFVVPALEEKSAEKCHDHVRICRAGRKKGCHIRLGVSFVFAWPHTFCRSRVGGKKRREMP